MNKSMLMTILAALMVAALAAPAMAQEPAAGKAAAPAADGKAGAQAQDDEDEDAEASVSSEGEGEAAEEEEPFPIGASVSVGGSFGAATLISNNQFTQTDFFSSRVSVGLSYQAHEYVGLSLGIGYSKFLTEDGSVFQREGRLSDTSLGVGFKGYTDEFTGITISPGVDFSFPTSDLSQAQNLYLTASGGLSFSRSFGGLSLSYSFGVYKNFHEFTSVVLDANELDVIARDGGVENVGNNQVAIDGVLSSFGVSNSFAVNFRFLDGFSAGLSLGYFDDFSYDNGTISRNDELVNENAAVGRGHSQGVNGGLRLGYRITDWLGASVSTSTGGQPLTNDNKSVRFPFWDFENGIAARTRFSFGLSANY